MAAEEPLRDVWVVFGSELPEKEPKSGKGVDVKLPYLQIRCPNRRVDQKHLDQGKFWAKPNHCVGGALRLTSSIPTSPKTHRQPSEG